MQLDFIKRLNKLPKKTQSKDFRVSGHLIYSEFHFQRKPHLISLSARTGNELHKCGSGSLKAFLWPQTGCINQEWVAHSAQH